MDASTAVGSAKAEDGVGNKKTVDSKPTYRSWKKKYRKMRILFDQKMHEGEELHRAEEKALATARRLAVEKDRLLDLLFDNNSCPQIPADKRFDLSIDPTGEDALRLGADSDQSGYGCVQPAKSYKQLLKDVPHHTFSSAGQFFPELVSDLEMSRDSPADSAQGIPHPPSFLSADDIDNYIWELDSRIGHQLAAKGDSPVPALPTLAPMATGGNVAPSGRDFVLRNPVSVYNWLRKHAPKTFLQDGEAHPGEKETGDDHHAANPTRGGGRVKGDRGGSGARSAGTSRSKRTGPAQARDKSVLAADNLENPEDDMGHDGTTPGGLKGKRKRVQDDDAGYRPKGGSSRPVKKKRKSEGVEAATPGTAPKKSRKSGGDVVMKE